MDAQAQVQAKTIGAKFYENLRTEVVDGNSYLDASEQKQLQSLYNAMVSSDRYPRDLTALIYTQRRQYPIAEILQNPSGFVLDAGCAFGSESFLFASLGARVLAVDIDPQRIVIAKKRLPYFEAKLGRKLDIQFEASNLDGFQSPKNLGLTWLSGVLAAVENQSQLLRDICEATCPGGKVMITDLNLLNPLFVYRVWRRQRRECERNAAYAANSSLLDLMLRRGRAGARYFRRADGTLFDDVQWFTPFTLERLLQESGFDPVVFHYNGFVSPTIYQWKMLWLEQLMSVTPGLNAFGLFYLGIGTKKQGPNAIR